MPSDRDWLLSKFCYYTECQLATLERYEMRKSSSKSETERHRRIASGMVGVVKSMEGLPEIRGLTRLKKALSASN